MPVSAKNPVIKRSPLARRFIIYMIFFSASITTITTMIQLYTEYSRDINTIESQYNQVKNVHLRSFTQSLWATNYQELRIQLEGLIKLPNIIYASVYNDQHAIIETGNKQANNFIERHFQMNYQFLDKKYPIGELTVITSLDNIYDSLLRDAITIFLNNALRTLLVIIFIYFIFHQLVSRHISQIAKHFQQLALGENKPLLLNRKPHGDPDELDLLVSSANEMQDRINRSHLALNESEKRYQTLTRVSPVGIFYTDTQGNCLYVNEKWSEIAGMDYREAEGRGWINGLHPDDLQPVITEWNHCAEKHKAFKLEYRFQQNDNTHWVLGQAIAEKNNDGEIIGYVGTITDITERKIIEEQMRESASRLEKIASRLPGMVYQFELRADGTAHFPYISDAVEEIYHLTAEEIQADISKIFAVVHPDDIDRVNQSIEQSALSLTPWKIEYRVCDADGSIRWLYGNSIPERTADGGTLWHGFVTDITKNKEMYENLKQAQKMDALGKLTGGIAHDYNNMLGVVLGYAELLLDQLSEQPRLKDYAEKITHAGERGAKLTRKLLSFTRHKASDSRALNINHLLKEERLILEKTLTARIQLALNLVDNLWLVYLDESELEDALLNISINAMHAISGNGHFTISSHNIHIDSAEAQHIELSAGDYVCLDITDTGCGMNQATKERIFDPFFSTKGEQGTGLGMSQVYGFMKRCGGTIKVESEPGHGCKFSLYFPRYQPRDRQETIR